MSSMKVLYDAQCFDNQKYGGISRYFTEMIVRLRASSEVDAEIALRKTENFYIRQLSPYGAKEYRYRVSSSDFLGGFQFKGRHRVISTLRKCLGEDNYAESRRKLQEGRFDLFHPTYYDPYFLDNLKGKPFILTIHDFIHEEFPHFFPKDPTTEYKERLARNASHVIAISEKTKSDAIRYYGLHEDQITIVHHGSPFAQVDKPSAVPAGIPPKFILFVGTRSSYKNFNMLLRSIAPLMAKDHDLFLICTGGGVHTKQGFANDEMALIKELHLGGKVLQVNATDSMLRALYSNAQCFVFPSLYEGFGIPILEAFACGCPVVLSDASSFPEVGGDAAVFMDPNHQESIRHSVEQVIYDEALKETLREKGYRQLAKFSWDKAAQQTMQVYQKVIGRI